VALIVRDRHARRGPHLTGDGGHPPAGEPPGDVRVAARDIAMQKISARLEGARMASAQLGV